jgi:hypothetical protein
MEIRSFRTGEELWPEIAQRTDSELLSRSTPRRRDKKGPLVSFAVRSDAERIDHGVGFDYYYPEDNACLTLLHADLLRRGLELYETERAKLREQADEEVYHNPTVDIKLLIPKRREGPYRVHGSVYFLQVTVAANLEDDKIGYFDGPDAMSKVDEWGSHMLKGVLEARVYQFIRTEVEPGSDSDRRVRPVWVSSNYNFAGIEPLRNTEDRWLTDENHPEFKAYLDKLETEVQSL